MAYQAQIFTYVMAPVILYVQYELTALFESIHTLICICNYKVIFLLEYTDLYILVKILSHIAIVSLLHIMFHKVIVLLEYVYTPIYLLQ